MGTIKLNLKAREKEPLAFSSWPQIWKCKKNIKAIKNHIGIKTARKLVKEFKYLCPKVERVSFSQIVITY